jgi:hypothetical protein
MKPLDLTRTAAAVEAYDCFDESLTPVVMAEKSARDQLAALDELEELAKAVGEAFADDTSDRNAQDTARLTRPNDIHLRKLLKEHAWTGIMEHLKDVPEASPEELTEIRKEWGV